MSEPLRICTRVKFKSKITFDKYAISSFLTIVCFDQPADQMAVENPAKIIVTLRGEAGASVGRRWNCRRRFGTSVPTLSTGRTAQ